MLVAKAKARAFYSEDLKMVKKIKNVWCKIIADDNIAWAYQKAKKGKSKYNAVRYIEDHKEECLKAVKQQLVEQTFKTGEYKIKIIKEPKEREIFVLPFYPDRIVQHAVINVLEPLFVKMFIADTYACIESRGIHKGSLRIMEFVRKNKYCLKMDIRKFYPSINHDILMQILERKIGDKQLMWLLNDIVRSLPGEKNVPIGNLTSQWFGNIYMNELDKFVKHNLKIKCYLRYCDDFALFSNDKKELNEAKHKIIKFLNEELKLTLSKCDLFRTTQGVDFLGYRHFKDYILIRKSTVKRVKKRLVRVKKAYLAGKMPHDKFRSIIASTDGWFKWANSHNLSLCLQLDELKEMAKNDKRNNTAKKAA